MLRIQQYYCLSLSYIEAIKEKTHHMNKFIIQQNYAIQIIL
jgi:hypothetical protein